MSLTRCRKFISRLPGQRDSYYCVLGTRYLDDDWFGPLADGHNVLPGKHAYSHMNSLSSAMQAYFTTDSEMHLRAARPQSFATGGWDRPRPSSNQEKAS